MDSLTEGGAVMVVTMGLVQITKAYVPSRYIPLLSIGIGILASVAYSFSQGTDLVSAVIAGVVVGLSASGTYDTVKGVAKGDE